MILSKKTHTVLVIFSVFLMFGLVSCFKESSKKSTQTPTISAPTGVTASQGTYSDKIEVSWNSVSDAVRYYIYRSDSATGTFTSIGYVDPPETTGINSTTLPTSYTITVGTHYFYCVTAANSSSQSALSSPVAEGWATAVSSTASVKLVNPSSSGYTAYYFYISSTSSTSWGVNQLGSNTVAPGSSYTINSIPPGSYDFKIGTSVANNKCSYLLNYTLTAGTLTTITISSWGTCSYKSVFEDDINKFSDESIRTKEYNSTIDENSELKNLCDDCEGSIDVIE